MKLLNSNLFAGVADDTEAPGELGEEDKDFLNILPSISSKPLAIRHLLQAVSFGVQFPLDNTKNRGSFSN